MREAGRPGSDRERRDGRREGGPFIGRTAIIGLGASGAAAARLVLENGGEVHVSDLRTDPATSARGDELAARGAVVELGGHDVARIAGATLVVVSPGIPPDAPVLRTLRDRGIRWISELELAWRHFRSPLIAVTGTNGKTTTAALAAHLLREGGLRAGLGGNIGAGLGPAASELALLEPPPDWLVVEASSFQLADIDRFAPDIGVVTNLAPDHLDRYPSVEAYFADKARLFENANEGSRWVLPADDAAVEALAGDAPGRRYRFGLRPLPAGDPTGAPAGDRGGEPAGDVAGESAGDAAGQPAGDAAGDPAGDPANGQAGGRAADGHRDGAREGAFVRDGMLLLRVNGLEEPLLPADELSLLGRHNVSNALAAALAARLAGTPTEAIRAGLRSFPPLPHRLEPVAERGGVLWVNDSKATNVAAAVSAVAGFDRPVVLLLGGKDKGEDFSRLAPALDARVRTAVIYGAAGDRIAAALEGRVDSGRVELRRVGDGFDEAVREAERAARAGDVILLAPACSSFDAFRDYEARGRRFAELARGEA